MLRSDITKLIKTLSAAEKRNFKLSTKNQSVDRAYITLFDLIDQTPFSDVYQLEEKFKKTHPNASFDSTASYLLKLVTDTLVLSNSEKNPFFQQTQCFLRARILFDRSLTNEGFKELKKVQKSASASQDHLMEYIAYREELNILSALNFPGINERTIVEAQMKGKGLLKTLLQIQEHYSLYEILKLRIINTGKTLTEQARKNLNDLLLSELSLITNKVSYNFESNKLHLLFQSFFFTSTGDYKSALKTFSELNQLFESNIKGIDPNPADYLSSLEGIVDSLRTIRTYDEMEFYITKIEGLIGGKHTEQFNYRAEKTAFTFRLNLFTARGEYESALLLLLEKGGVFLKEVIISDYEKHCELLFYAALTYFGLDEWEKALKQISRIAFPEKENKHFVIYKAAKLMDILIRYEMGDTDYLQYEIRAYKRMLRYKAESLQIEKLIFKVVIIDPNVNSVVKNKFLYQKLQPLISLIAHQKYELQVLKYFDFTGWITAKFNTQKPKSRRRKGTIHKWDGDSNI